MSRQQQVDRQILRIALPAIGENFLQMLMGMVDSYLVAQLGLVAVSGVSVAGNIITIYQAIFIALGAAVVSLLSKSMGQKDQKAIARQATESIKVTVLISLVLGTLSLRLATIKQVYEQDHELIDPHTADGVKVAREVREAPF